MTSLLRSLSSDGGAKPRAPRVSKATSRKHLQKALSTQNIVEAGSGMAMRVAHGLEEVAHLGAAGVVASAQLGAAGVVGAATLATNTAHLGAAGVVGAATLATNTALGKARTSTARKRNSEFNVFGDGDLVSVDFLLESMQAARKNQSVTKLELEDLVHGRDESRDACVHQGVASLLKNDGDRPWKYIKIIDSIRIMDANGMNDIQNYEKRRQALWDHIKTYAEGKPVMFQLKVEIMEDTPAAGITSIFNLLLGYNLARIEFLGELYGVKPPDIGDALADLCRPDDPSEKIRDCGFLREMILLSLHYATCDSDRGRSRVWQKVLRRSVRRLGGTCGGLGMGDSEHGHRSESEHSDKSRERSGSPRTRVSDTSAMKARPSKAMAKPTMRRTASDGKHLTKVPSDKRSKPRTFGQPINDFLNDSDPSLAGHSDASDNEDHKSHAKCNECGDEKPIECPSKLLKNRRQAFMRSLSDKPCQKREPLVRQKSSGKSTSPDAEKRKTKKSSTSPDAEKRKVKRSASDSQKKVARALSDPSKKKSSKNGVPAYDWGKHSDYDGKGCGTCGREREMDEKHGSPVAQSA